MAAGFMKQQERQVEQQAVAVAQAEKLGQEPQGQTTQVAVEAVAV